MNPRKKINLSLRSFETGNLSADNFQKYSTSMGRHLSPRYGQVILVSGCPVLIAVNWSQHWCAISFLLGSQTTSAKSVRVNTGFPVVRTDGRRAVGQCTVTWLPNFLGWVDLLSCGAPLLFSLRRKVSGMVWTEPKTLESARLQGET